MILTYFKVYDIIEKNRKNKYKVHNYHFKISFSLVIFFLIRDFSFYFLFFAFTAFVTLIFFIFNDPLCLINSLKVNNFILYYKLIHIS